MNENEKQTYNFSSWIKRTELTDDCNVSTMWHAIALCGEVGELIGEIKKNVVYGLDPNIDAITKEIGDVIWYTLAIMRRTEGLNPTGALRMDIVTCLESNIVSLTDISGSIPNCLDRANYWPVDHWLPYATASIVSLCINIANHYGIQMSDIDKANEEKLAERHGLS